MMSKSNPMPRGRGAVPPMKRKFKGNPLKRVLKMLIGFYPVLLPVAITCIVFAAIVSALPAIFNQQIIAAIEEWYISQDWASAKDIILPKIILLIVYMLFRF